MVRIPGVCNRNPETTVLAHVPMAGYSGRGFKAPDEEGAFACSDCHDAVDFRVNKHEFSRAEIRLMHMEGAYRTRQRLKELGLLRVGK